MVDKEVTRSTRTLAEFVSKTTFEALPAEVIHEAKRLLLDSIGVTLAGARTEIGDITFKMLKYIGAGSGKGTVIGSKEKTSYLDAANANHRNGNALDADDAFNGPHFGCPTSMAALAACEMAQASGKDLLTSIALGFDVGARVILALGPPSFNPETRSYGDAAKLRAPSPVMALACTAAAAKAMKLSAEQTFHAIGMGAYSGAQWPWAKWTAAKVAPLLKQSDYGTPTASGVRAALLAKLGTTAFEDVLDGESGLLLQMTPDANFELLLRDIGKRWLLVETSYKPWPSCRWTHSPATAFYKILKENDLKVEEIEHVLLLGHAVATDHRFRNKEPKGWVTCQFNNPHVIAMLAYGVKRGIEWYCKETLNDPRIQAFRKKVDVELEPESLKIPEWVKDGVLTKVPATAEVKARGKTYRQLVYNAWGDPYSHESFFTDDDLRAKFTDFTSSAGVGLHQIEKIIEVVSKLEQLDDLGQLTGLLT
ncbi:MmgE/PrpD family protein [Chloroflexota bacterium]